MKLYQFAVMLSLVFTSGLFISCEEDDNLPKIEQLENPIVSPLSGSTWKGSIEEKTYYIRFEKSGHYNYRCYFCKPSESISDYYYTEDYIFQSMLHDSYNNWERDANTISFGSRSHDYGPDYGPKMEYILKRAVLNKEENSMDLYGREISSDDERLLMTMSRVRQ